MSDETVSRPTDPHLEHRGPLPAGTPPRIGKYEVLRVLGAGAFGRVYLCFDPKIRRYVAVKMPLLPPESSDAFLREARVLADVHNENICPIYDADAHNDIPFIAMRYVSGGTLGDWLKSTQPTVNQALRFAEQIARGLDAAHTRGIVHRDLKPDNILYDRDADQLLLTDFGLAKWTGSAAATTGGAKGTPAYMAPEQCSPDRFGPVSPRSDVYALGVILFRMLTGEPLFTVPPDAEGWGAILAMMAKHTDEAPRAPSAVCRAVSPRLDAVCLKALAKRPADRYQSAVEFAAAVTDYLNQAAATAQKRTWLIDMPGIWYARPTERPDAEWAEVARTPAKIIPDSGEVYKFKPHNAAQNTLKNLARLADFESLQSIDLYSAFWVNDGDLRHLRAVALLRQLDLGACEQVSDAGLKHLGALTSLRQLD